jgi:hypothetical protein
MKVAWETIDQSVHNHNSPLGVLLRTKVPGGWLVIIAAGPVFKENKSLTFYPDPEHQWDGNSLSSEQG